MSKSRLFSLSLLMLVAVIAAGLFLMYRDTQSPDILLTPDGPYVSKVTEFTVEARDQSSAIRRVVVSAEVGGQTVPILDTTFTQGDSTASTTFNLAALPLDQGLFDLTITATDSSFAKFGKGNTASQTYNFIIDTTPPQIILQSQNHYVRQGGACCVVFRTDEESHSTGVALGDRFYPAFQQDNGTFVCFFPFPYDMEVDAFQPKLKAVDAAGNERITNLSVNPSPRTFHEDTLNIPDSFLERKMPDFESAYPGQMTQLERYIKVNNDLRAKNQKTLFNLGAKTAGTPLWKGNFGRLPNAANRAGFGDKRTYVYKNEVIDHQIHMGIDLASTKMAEVPASNSGTVIFAGMLGIYGQTVIIDHGLGLQSLYAHLSSYDVKEGQQVAKDEIIGKTGTTGLAGGDHLHFGILVHGVAVTPVEWWDAHWIQDNVADRLPAVKTASGE